MLDKKIIKQFIKYLIMFMFVFALCHVMSGDCMPMNKCAILALGSATVFLVLDYVAPSCTVNINGTINIADKCYK
jgi:hypothetical protein